MNIEKRGGESEPSRKAARVAADQPSRRPLSKSKDDLKHASPRQCSLQLGHRPKGTSDRPILGEAKDAIVGSGKARQGPAGCEYRGPLLGQIGADGRGTMRWWWCTC